MKKYFKNMKITILCIIVLIIVIALSVFYFASQNKTDGTQNTKNSSDVTNNIGKNEDAQKQENEDKEQNKTEEKPNLNEKLNEGNGPVNTENSGDDIVSKIDKFNSLEDGNPEKEKIRDELEALFESAEGVTLN